MFDPMIRSRLPSFAASPMAGAAGGAPGGAGPQLAHIVFFDLHDHSSEARQKLVAACQKYLTGHEGTVYFSAGMLADDYNRPVNDRDFDVALHIVFESKAAHDKYQTHPRHLAFVEENKPSFKRVRVFDSYLAT